MKLYDLQLSLQALEEFTPGTPEEQKALFDAINGLQVELNDKVDAIVSTIKDLESDIDAIATEQRRLAERKNSLENRNDSIRYFLKDFLKSVNIEKVKTARFTCSIKKTPPKLTIIIEGKLPMQCYETKTVVNNDLVKTMVINGLIDPSIAKVTQNETVSIR